MKTVAQFKDSVAALLTGVNLDNVTDLNGSLERAARILVQRAYIPEASDTYSFMLYDGVFDNPAPATIFGGSFVDMRPEGVDRSSDDYTYKKPVEVFDRTKFVCPTGYEVAFEFNKGTPVMRVATSKTTKKITLDLMNSLTGWTAGGNASGLALDSTVFYQSSGALRFNLAVSGSQGYIEKTIQSQNLSTYAGVGVVFIAVRLPSTAPITSIGIHLGSSSANYWDVSNTRGFLGAFVSGQYLLVALDLSLATTTGTVDATKITYARVYINYDGTALTNVRLGALFIALPTPTKMLFQTSAIFLSSSTGSLSQTITTDNDSITLSDPALTLYEHEAALNIGLQGGGSINNSPRLESINQTLFGVRSRTGAIIQLGLYDQYHSDNPSEELSAIGNYYNE